MAGSWKHMITKSGKLRSNESFTGMIENLGDAYEAQESYKDGLHTGGVQRER
jgi:hypothetical protein